MKYLIPLVVLLSCTSPYKNKDKPVCSIVGWIPGDIPTVGIEYRQPIDCDEIHSPSPKKLNTISDSD